MHYGKSTVHFFMKNKCLNNSSEPQGALANCVISILHPIHYAFNITFCFTGINWVDCNWNNLSDFLVKAQLKNGAKKGGKMCFL